MPKIIGGKIRYLDTGRYVITDPIEALAGVAEEVCQKCYDFKSLSYLECKKIPVSDLKVRKECFANADSELSKCLKDNKCPGAAGFLAIAAAILLGFWALKA